ncbi:MAG TPA: ribosome silencing factor [Opitutaceae bacterium]|nr:ribosome silencing factor [Opitutaceae bacterium]
MKTKTPKADVPAILKPLCVALEDKKAGDIRVLRVSEQSSITDYLIVATGTSDPHLRALRVELEKVLDLGKVHIVGMDTSQESGWLVIDAFDVMIHILTAENREKYALENLWKDAEEVPLADITAEPKPEPSETVATAVKDAAGQTTPPKKKRASAGKPKKKAPSKKSATAPKKRAASPKKKRAD